MYSKKSMFLFMVVTVFGMHLAAQTTTPSYIPNVIPPSPNAASLMKFTDVPVSPYTGTSDIAVPIYEIQAKGITVPVSLNYHTGGIRLNEESGWVGLGWTLNAGGMISRTIRDQDDFTGTYFGGALMLKVGDLADIQTANSPSGIADILPPRNINKYCFAFNCHYNVFLTDGDNIDYYQPFHSVHQTRSYADMEPDSYSYNFCGQSGKFIIRPDKTIVLEKQDNIRIQLVQDDAAALADYSFLITDDKGNRYIFKDKEYGGPASSPNQLSSWHLTKIVTQQNDIVKFNYIANGSLFVPEQTTQVYNIGCSNSGNQYYPQPATLYTNSVLQSIDYTNGQVQFIFDNLREDLQGGSKLNTVKLYSKTTAGLRYLKEHRLYYSYFFANAQPSAKYEMERLRLDSVKEANGSTFLKPYIFTYNSTNFNMVGKHDYGIDHWGYYNGTNNTTLIPTISTSYWAIGSYGHAVNYSGANRTSNAYNSQIFALQQVKYPTGGKTVLEYSSNEYDHSKSVIGVNEFPQLDQVTVDTSFNVTATTSGVFDFSKIVALSNASINIAFVPNDRSAGWSTSDRNNFGRLFFQTGGSAGSNIVDLTSSSLSCSGGVCSTTIIIPSPTQSATAYTWNTNVDASIAPRLAQIRVRVFYQAYRLRVNQVNNVYKETAGGLRINSITDYSDSVTIAKKRVWDYGYTSGGAQYTHGRLMSFPSYVHYEQVGQSDGNGICPNLVLMGSSITGLSSSIQGNIVGYSQVTEYAVDPVTNANLGKTIYSFFNSPDSTIDYGGYRKPGTLNMGNHLNGSLLTKKLYRNSGGAYYKVSEVFNYYRTANRKVYFIPKYDPAWPVGSGGSSGGKCNGTSTGVESQVLAWFYPLIKSERILMDSTRNVMYDQNDTTKFMASTSKSYYDNPVHYQLTRTKFQDSRGYTHVIKLTYPQDYLTVGGNTNNIILDSLIRRNMVTENIEKRDSLYSPGASTGNVTGASNTMYKQLSNGVIVADKIYKLDVVNPVNNFQAMTISGSTYNQDVRNRSLINLDLYDNASNITQYTPANAPPVAIIWDYRQMQAIAQIKNSTLANTAFTSFEADGLGNWTTVAGTRDSVTTAFTGVKSLALGSMTKTGLTSGTIYVVSYWKNNTTPLTIAGTISGYPIRDTTANGWTYFEHKVAGQTTITLSGTGNVDEVRLYPQDAQMTSYTYDPQVGVTSIDDAKGMLNFFEYDGFQRLINIRDQFGNILKHTDYHYYGQ